MARTHVRGYEVHGPIPVPPTLCPPVPAPRRADPGFAQNDFAACQRAVSEASSGGMATVGEYLRAGRAARQLTLHQVGETTKIRTDYLEALESGDYNRFVAPVYIRGFVRAYATMLRLDLPQVMACLLYTSPSPRD